MRVDLMICCMVRGIPGFLATHEASSLELAQVAAALAKAHDEVVSLLRQENSVLAETARPQLQSSRVAIGEGPDRGPLA